MDKSRSWMYLFLVCRNENKWFLMFRKEAMLYIFDILQAYITPR